MAGSFNRVILVGNLTRDPEIRYVQSGAGVVKFTLAVNRRTKNGDETTYIDITAWEKLAETCNTYLKKGSSVLVEGRLVIRNYEDKDGNKRKATEIVIDTMQMLDRKESGSAGGSSYDQGHREHATASEYASQYQPSDDEIDGEIPF
jgi:single-strand DNA-binding protein